MTSASCGETMAVAVANETGLSNFCTSGPTKNLAGARNDDGSVDIVGVHHVVHLVDNWCKL